MLTKAISELIVKFGIHLIIPLLSGKTKSAIIWPPLKDCFPVILKDCFTYVYSIRDNERVYLL